MSKMKLKDEICHLFVEQDNSEKLIIEVYFDISDFKIEQEIYDFFGEKIYGNGREHLNDIYSGTKLFGGGLSSFHDYFRGYLKGIHLTNRSEFLSIIMTNSQNSPVSDFLISFLNTLMQTFFYSYMECNYCNFFDIKVSKNIMNSSMDHFSFLISDYADRPADLLDEDGNYL